jgi:phosphoenolpyruvate carboxykinase (ATP)
MPRHPTVYAGMLGELMRHHEADCWLVNTGWSGGPYGTGQRIRLRYTRAMLHAALDGKLAEVGFRKHRDFGLLMPESCPDVPREILDPKATWDDAEAYDRTAQELAGRFEANFERFAPHVGAEVRAAAIHAGR